MNVESLSLYRPGARCSERSCRTVRRSRLEIGDHGGRLGRAVVENANLTVKISALRRILDEGRTEGSCIQTAAVRGYRFIPTAIRMSPEHGKRNPRRSVSEVGQGMTRAQRPEDVRSECRETPAGSRFRDGNRGGGSTPCRF